MASNRWIQLRHAIECNNISIRPIPCSRCHWWSRREVGTDGWCAWVISGPVYDLAGRDNGKHRLSDTRLHSAFSSHLYMYWLRMSRYCSHNVSMLFVSQGFSFINIIFDIHFHTFNTFWIYIQPKTNHHHISREYHLWTHASPFSNLYNILIAEGKPFVLFIKY